MPAYLTPGVYFEKPRPHETPLPQRTDITGFVGLAERGPVHTPVRLKAWRQFQRVFGGFLPYSHLAYSVRAFFENGGRVCWVVRVADIDLARAAEVNIRGEGGITAYRVSAIDPGTWGNGLSISVQSANIAASQSIFIHGLETDRLAVAALAGFEVASLVQLTQEQAGAINEVAIRVIEVDVARGFLRFDRDLAANGFLLGETDPPINIRSLEFTLLVRLADQVIERFENLAPDPEHSRDAVELVNSLSGQVRLQRQEGSGLPDLPWRGALEGGNNGLRTLNIFDYTGTPQGDAYGLAALEKIDEIGLLVIPDLTIRPQQPPPLERASHRRIDECALDTPTARIDVQGRVLDTETNQPLAGVEIAANDGLAVHETVSGSNGSFDFTGLLPENIELVFNLAKYEEQILRIDTGEVDDDVRLTPLDLPPALNDEDIFYGQSAMVAQCEKLRDRFAILDPPPDDRGNLLSISGLQGWRARFDTAFAALYYPWLRINDPLAPEAPQGRLLPPGGHVAGNYAVTDLESGVFRAPANRPLSWVDDLGAVIDDAQQGILNPQGINVIRAFPGRGIRIYGGRTMSSDSAWRFVNVRRLMSMLEEAMHDGLQWAVFEPNDDSLRIGLRSVLVNMLDALWRRGAFAGETAEAAYHVRCDAVTTPPEEQALGRMIAEVAVAPTVPYEFIVLRLGLTRDELLVSEV